MLAPAVVAVRFDAGPGPGCEAWLLKLLAPVPAALASACEPRLRLLPVSGTRAREAERSSESISLPYAKPPSSSCALCVDGAAPLAVALAAALAAARRVDVRRAGAAPSATALAGEADMLVGFPVKSYR